MSGHKHCRASPGVRVFHRKRSEHCDICTCRFLLGTDTMNRGNGGAGIMNGSYRDLKVWRSSMKLVLKVYTSTKAFPKDELYGLVSQMRRASVSIPSNIAEGKGRLSDRDRTHFYLQARGSLLELETQTLIARELNYLSMAESEALVHETEEIGRMLNGLVQAIRPCTTEMHEVASRA